MPRINFSKIEDVQDFTPLPKGSYPCEVVKVEEQRTQRGDEMWRLSLAITQGEYKGRYVFDNLVFSEKGQKRVKHLCNALGLDVSNDVDLTSDMLLGRMCNVDVDVEDYEDGEGRTRTCNCVPFAGYSPSDDTSV